MSLLDGLNPRERDYSTHSSGCCGKEGAPGQTPEIAGWGGPRHAARPVDVIPLAAGVRHASRLNPLAIRERTYPLLPCMRVQNAPYAAQVSGARTRRRYTRTKRAPHTAIGAGSLM